MVSADCIEFGSSFYHRGTEMVKGLESDFAQHSDPPSVWSRWSEGHHLLDTESINCSDSCGEWGSSDPTCIRSLQETDSLTVGADSYQSQLYRTSSVVSAHKCSCDSVKLSSRLWFTHLFPESLCWKMHEAALWKHMKTDYSGILLCSSEYCVFIKRDLKF